MWTAKQIDKKCPTCGGDVMLTVQMFAKDILDVSLPGAQMKFAAHTAPVVHCVGNWNPPLGEPMWPECEWMLKGTFDGEGSALFRPW